MISGDEARASAVCGLNLVDNDQFFTLSLIEHLIFYRHYYTGPRPL